AQSFFQRPQRVLLAFSVHQNQPRRIETEPCQPMAVKRTAAGEARRGKHEEDGSFRHAAEEGGSKAEGRRKIGCRFRRDLVQRARGEPAAEMPVERRLSEGERGAIERGPVEPRQKPAQHFYLGAAARPERSGTSRSLWRHERSPNHSRLRDW